MASYKHSEFLQANQSEEFDKTHEPGVAAPYAGIYKCTKCKHEIGIAAGHTLPPQSHPQHPTSLGPIQWQLVVYAMHNK